MKKKIRNVTLVAVASTKVNQTYKAIKYSLRYLSFDSVKFFTNEKIKNHNSIIKIIKIKKLNSIKDWSEFVIFDLHKFIKTKYILLIHWDGFVINYKKWNKDFLNYDYVGAPFPIFKRNFFFRKVDKLIMGNSVSLRSKKLLELPSKLNLNWKDGWKSNYHEDGYLCNQKKKLLVSKGIKFAPVEIGYGFAREYTFTKFKNQNPFVFHKWYGFNKKYNRLGNKKTFTEKIKTLFNFGIYD